MARGAKLLASMRANPRGDWTIADVATVCRAYGIECAPPSRGSHYQLNHPGIEGRLTVPSRKPIKAVYIQLLVDMVDALSRL